MIVMLRQKNVRIILWTAPTTLRNLEMPLYFLKDGNANVTSNVLAIHNKYNQLLRDIAEANDVELIDLARSFSRFSEKQAMACIDDTVHFTGAGEAWFLQEIARYLLYTQSSDQ